MSDEVKFDPYRIQRHADELTRIEQVIEDARTSLNSAIVEGGDFSITGTACAMAYPGALDFAFLDTATHKMMVDQFAKKIVTVAKTWHATESVNTTNVSEV